MFKNFLWIKLGICALVALNIPLAIIEMFEYGNRIQATSLVRLVIGLLALRVGYTTYKIFLKNPKNGNGNSVALDARTVMLVRKISWPLLLIPFGFAGALFALLIFSINELPITLTMLYFYFSMLAYFVWRMIVFRKKYGVEFRGPIALNQLFVDIIGGKIIYFFIVGNTLVMFSILYLSMQLTEK